MNPVEDVMKQKWKYKQTVLLYDHLLKEQPTSTQWLNAHGGDGWELVSVNRIIENYTSKGEVEGNRFLYTFKKPDD